MRSRTLYSMRWVLASGALVFLSGCGGTGTVTGKVTLDGEPLPGGIVLFHHVAGPESESAPPPNGRISTDGTFVAANVPTGKTLVTIMTAPKMGSVAHPDAGLEPWGPYVPIPAKYKDPDKSGFTIEVKLGKQELNLAMTGDPATDGQK
jgi:hypothetical protein